MIKNKIHKKKKKKKKKRWYYRFSDFSKYQNTVKKKSHEVETFVENGRGVPPPPPTGHYN